MENEVKKSAGKVWLIPTIVAAVLLIGLVVFMVIMGKGTSALADGTVTLSEAVSPLQDGTAQLSDGVDQYTGGVDTMNEAMPTLQDGVKQYTEGVDQLNGYMKKLNAAAPELASGVKQLADGSAQLDAAYNDINSIADTVAATLNSVRPTVVNDANYKLLNAGATGVAEQLDVNKAGSFAQAVVGMNTIITKVDTQAAGLAGLNGMESTLGGLFVTLKTGSVTPDTFVTAASSYVGGEAKAKDLQPVYAMWLASGTDLSSPTEAAAYLAGLKTAGATVHSGLNTASAETANKKPVEIAQLAVGALVANASDPNKNVHTAAAQVAGGIPTLIDTICTNLENGAAAQVDTTNPKSLKSSLKTYSDGVRAVAKGTSDLNKAVNGKDGLVSSVAQLYKDGTAKLAENSQALRDGVKQLADGAKQLSDNSQALRDGASQLKDAAPALIDGIGQLVDGAKKVNGFTPIH